MVLLELLVFAAGICAKADALAGSEDMTVGRAVRSLYHDFTENVVSGEPQDLQIIAAGLGRTGSSSLKLALKKLGYKPYHMADGVMETPGHMGMWAAHGKAMLKATQYDRESDKNYADDRSVVQKKPVLSASGLIERFHAPNIHNQTVRDSCRSIMHEISRAGFNATTDMPMCYLYRELAELYPNARIILTKRASGEAWSRSIRKTIGGNMLLFNQPPFSWLPMMQGAYQMNRWMWAASGIPEDSWKESEFWDEESALSRTLAAAHDRWSEKVRESIPAERLIELEPVSGPANWAKLCEHLKPLGNEIVNKNCEGLMAEKEDWPWENQNLQLVYKVFRGVVAFAKVFPAIFAILLLVCVFRKTTQKATQKDKKS